MSWIEKLFGTKISPIIIFIIVLLAIIFFIFAFLHLLIRFLFKKQRSLQTSHNNLQTRTSSRTFQRQLQHLFNLHDSGLDQAHIDSLPVFCYKDVVVNMGSKEPFDCAVCLCEFAQDDKLRLLPLCSHAFHIDCIETWLLSNSTCPLCRGVILSFDNPIFRLEDCKEDSKDGVLENNCDDSSAFVSGKRVFSVRLGKLKSGNVGVNLESEEVGESSNGNLDCRRCYSMGSFQYVVGDEELQVALCNTSKEGGGEGQNGNFTSGVGVYGKKISSGSKGESFSVSKIWLWSKKGKFSGSEGTHYSSDHVGVSLP